MYLRFTTAASPLGRLLVARTDRGISVVTLAKTEAAAERKLRREFPRAELKRDPRGLSHAARQIVAFLEGKRARVDVPLDLHGTPFQMRVWKELRRIPFGSTKTYGEVARAIGTPGAARAVGTACGSNPVALLVPCHRVVAGGGRLGGFGLGLGTKQALLEQEARGRRRQGTRRRSPRWPAVTVSAET